MPEYQAPTVADTGDTFPATYPIELAGSVVFVNFEVRTYEAPANTNVNFNLGREFESADNELVFSPSVSEEIGFNADESIQTDLVFSPTVTEAMAGGDIEEDLTVAEFGDTFPGTFPFELGPDQNLGLVLDVSIQEFSDTETIYGETLARAERKQTVITTGEQSIVTLGQADKQDIERGDAEIN